MGLLDELLSAATSATGTAPSAASHATLAHAVLDMLSNQQAGGLQGLAQSFEQQGLGQLMSSWVGQGPNAAVSPAQIQQVLGHDRLAELSQRTGIPPAVVSSALTTMLPTLVDKLTPNGSIQHSLLQDGIALLRSQLSQPS